MLHEALDASQTERRRIAADLHDGVVQDLVGVSYTLAAHAERLDGEGDAAAGAALRDGASKTRESVRALRTLLVDIYPPNLHRAGLAAALGDLARTYSARGLRTSVEVEPGLTPTEATERLLFRVAQESLRNTFKHANATSATVSIGREDADRLVLEAIDDGHGFDPGRLNGEADPGHFGIQLLRDRAEEAGGDLDVTSVEGRGTTVRMELPA
jgi:signal transduction histidine kinase